MLKKIRLSADFKKLHCITGLDGPGRVRKTWPAGRTSRDFQARRYEPGKTDNSKEKKKDNSSFKFRNYLKA
jgi:hypothetical protein